MVLSGVLALGCSSGDRALGNNNGGRDTIIAPPDPVFHLGYVKNDGSQQTAVVGTELRLPLLVQVFNRNVPAAGVFVTWSTESGGGMNPVLAKTDEHGLSASRFRTGTRAGIQAAIATLNNESIIFYLRVGPDAPTRALIDFGDGDSVRTGGYLTLVVRALDQYGNGVPDLPVGWQVLAGDASLVGGPDPTASNGQSVIVVRFGTVPGPATVTATVSGFTPLTFNIKSY